jgi:NSS family neurotransmitter:Na+ symporter
VTRPRFSGSLATVLTMLGVAIGLGNVWRFPYMMGRYGGSAFLVVYLLFMVGLGIPALMAEWAFGRATRQGPVGAFSAAFGARVGRPLGLALLLGILVANSYYLVIIANVVYSTYFSLLHGFRSENSDAFQAGLGNGLVQYGLAVAVLVVSVWVLHRGVNRGIVTVSKVFVPFFGVVVVYLVVHALSLEGALPAFARFLRPDFSLMGPQQLFAAMGQASFSVGLGGTLMLVYGSYLSEDERLGRSALLTGLGDTGAALLASLFLVPTMLVFHLDMTSGPTLIFATLPQLFQFMPAGRVLGSLFLTALTAVAFLSNVAALEAFVGGLSGVGRWSRKRLLAAVLLLEVVLILPSALRPSNIAHLDLVFGSGMMMLGSALALLGITRGLGRRALAEQVGDSLPAAWKGGYLLWVRWVVPAALLLLLAGYVYSTMLQMSS